VPAAAVIPAPIAYTNIVAVKKLVVGSGARDCRTGRALMCRSSDCVLCEHPLHIRSWLYIHGNGTAAEVSFIGWPKQSNAASVVVTVNKTACPKQALGASHFRLND